ncbi:MAG: glycosyl hydrolase [Clostridiaceae bacterium]|nr:glycosyl hydrolase [Clostridiaceae bacterium]
MSLLDKIKLCSGANFWETKKMDAYGIPAVFMCDGPHGLRKQEHTERVDMLGINDSVPATCFPTAVTTAGSWDPDLLEKIGRRIAEEAVAYDVALVLGPGANIKRSPLCGRNFEYFSEDPFLTGKLAAGFIRGLQDNGTAACLKHFALNNQEYHRFNSDSVLDERTMREIYLTGFEIAVKESQPATVMCAYNKINGVHCSDSRMLLTDILRHEWGFDGMVVTDWGGLNDRIAGFAAGCDLNMPGGSDFMEKEALTAVKNGSLSEAAVTASAARVIDLVLKHRANEVARSQLQGQNESRNTMTFSIEEHHQLALEAAEQGAVLLKNEDRILPLKESDTVAWIGNMAQIPRYQGAGSSHIRPLRLLSLLDILPEADYAPGCKENGDTSDELIAEAVSLAKTKKTAVIFAGLPDQYESEGFDRETLLMPRGHLKLIAAVAQANPQTVVVLNCGSVVECPWEKDVKGILYMGLAGQAGIEATLNILYGKVNPSGKLAESWPYSYTDCPVNGFYRQQQNAQYREGIYVGYRYYDKAEVPVRFPFGYGLSYTDFEYTDLAICDAQASLTVTNTGQVAGADVVQLYVLPPSDGLHRPAKELKGFVKVFLQPGEHKVVSFTLDRRSFSVWSDGWKIPAGEYIIAVGASSKDLRLQKTITISGEIVAAPNWQSGSWYEQPQGPPSQADWEQLLGREYVEPTVQKGQYTMDHTIVEMQKDSLIMRIVYRFIERFLARKSGGKKDYRNPLFRLFMSASVGSPLRSLQITSGIKGGLFKGLLEMANGHFFRGIIKMFTD